MRQAIFLSTLFICIAANYLQAQNNIPKKFKLPKEILEASGLYYAGKDSLWWLNDSGNPPELFLTDQKGHLKQTVLLPAVNRDWEDLTADNQGNIYIGEFGNNQNKRQDLRIYIYHPSTNALDSILFSYPDQHAFPPAPGQCNFDMEGFFWHNDSLHLFSKNRLLKGNYYTKHYTLPAHPGNFVAALKDSVYLKNRVVTAAAISPDNQTVALLAYYFKKCLGFIPISRATVFTFQNFDNTHFLKGKVNKKRVGKFLIPTQFECLDFIDNQRVYIASERTPLFKQQAKLVKLKSATIKP